MNQNRVDASMTEQERADILNALQEIENRLPFLVGLTVKEKKNMSGLLLITSPLKQRLAQECEMEAKWKLLMVSKKVML